VAVIPWSVTTLVAVVLSITLVPILPGTRGVITAEPSAARQLANTTIGLAGRYGGALVALAVGLRGRRRAARTARAVEEP